MRPGVAAVLFDLDGTLIDSAPDLAGAANDMRVLRGLPPLPYDAVWPHAGSGARGMLGPAFDTVPGQAGYDALRDEFHAVYAERMLRSTQLYAASVLLLKALDHHRVPWGIVTNKALRFAEPLTRALGLSSRAAVLIGGDSTPFSKPHPAPLLEAARRLGQPPPACIYVGDDERDMRAGRAAGMATLAAAWGYLGPHATPLAWRADHVLLQPTDLLQWLDLA